MHRWGLLAWWDCRGASTCGRVRGVEGVRDHWAKPVVTVPAPVRGWRRASTPRRACALAAVPVVALWSLGLAVPTPLWAVFGGALGSAAAVVYAVVGPTVCYASARVLRPHREAGGERIVRHPLAAAGTAYGLPLVVAAPLVNATGWSSGFAATYGPAGLESGSGLDTVLVVMTLSGLGAAALGALTAAWGLLAVLVRASALLAAVAAHRRRLAVEELS